MKTIGEIFKYNLRRLRQSKPGNLRQEDMDERLGLAPNTYQRWESGKLPREDERILALAKFFDVSVGELVLDPDAAPPPTSTLDEQTSQIAFDAAVKASKNAEFLAQIPRELLTSLMRAKPEMEELVTVLSGLHGVPENFDDVVRSAVSNLSVFLRGSSGSSLGSADDGLGDRIEPRKKSRRLV